MAIQQLLMGGQGDPFWNSVELLLHCDNGNGSTTLIDSSQYNHTMISNNGAAQATANPKFGVSSIESPEIPNDRRFYCTTLNTLAGDFTIEGWWFPTTALSYRSYMSFGTTWDLYTEVGIGNNMYLWKVANRITGGVGVLPTLNAWNHIAWTRQSGIMRLWLNGTQLGSDYSDSSSITSAMNLNLGRYGSSGEAYIGQIDEFRITNGVCRYTAPFSVPTAPFPNSR